MPSPKWQLAATDTVATMGSCFAQHIARWLRQREFNVPFFDTVDDGEIAFSANYGNVYTVAQARQLIQEAAGERRPSQIAWASPQGGFVDALRPAAVAALDTADGVVAARAQHLGAIRDMVRSLDVLVFTLGLTEAWRIVECGTVLPTAPGTVAGAFDEVRYEFVNFDYHQIVADLAGLIDSIRSLRDGRDFRLLLTVSPVPLTATATGQHVLVASTYSKATLRAAAQALVDGAADVDYFPSFEIINNPAARSSNFESNLRTVRPEAVDMVMETFARRCIVGWADREPATTATSRFDPDCEDALLERFAPSTTGASDGTSAGGAGRPIPGRGLVVIGDSHLASARDAIEQETRRPSDGIRFAPVGWLQDQIAELVTANGLTELRFLPEYREMVADITVDPATDTDLVIVGLLFGGDGIIRQHGPLLPGSIGCDGRSISPTMPEVASIAEAAAMYRPLAEQTIALARLIERGTAYGNIVWIAAPDFVDGTARFRLGDRFVDSGQYRLHQRGFATAFAEIEHGLVRTTFLTHGDHKRDRTSGFVEQRFASTDVGWDIHASPDFYRDVSQQLGIALSREPLSVG